MVRGLLILPTTVIGKQRPFVILSRTSMIHKGVEKQLSEMFSKIDFFVKIVTLLAVN